MSSSAISVYRRVINISSFLNLLPLKRHQRGIEKLKNNKAISSTAKYGINQHGGSMARGIARKASVKWRNQTSNMGARGIVANIKRACARQHDI